LVAERFVSGPHVLADVPRNLDPLDGFLFWAGGEGLAFVNADDILTRRRFTAAHELGHALLHRARMGRFRTDTKILDDAEDTDDLEREANRFAAELLMPEEVCRAREAELREEDKARGGCPRGVLAYRLASELLVSREAIRYRLAGLGVGDDE
jgi:Zn-dependent peptidase ImmA (M78 family)